MVQVGLLATFGIVWSRLPARTREAIHSDIRLSPPALPDVDVPRREPLRVQPLYDDREVVSDEELAAVLAQIRP